MSEDTTRKFPASFEERVLSELAAIRQEVTQQNARLTSVETRLTSVETHLTSLETRLTSLEDKVDERLRETRPIWESVQAQLKEIDRRLDTLNRQFKMVIQDLYDLRVRVEKLEDSQPI